MSSTDGGDDGLTVERRVNLVALTQDEDIRSGLQTKLELYRFRVLEGRMSDDTRSKSLTEEQRQTMRYASLMLERLLHTGHLDLSAVRERAERDDLKRNDSFMAGNFDAYARIICDYNSGDRSF